MRLALGFSGPHRLHQFTKKLPADIKDGAERRFGVG